MKTIATGLIAAAAAVFASAGTAEAQWGGYYGGYGGYGYGGYSPYSYSVYGPTSVTSTPYRGSIYSGGFGGLGATRSFSYTTTLPGGGVYGYSSVQPYGAGYGLAYGTGYLGSSYGYGTGYLGSSYGTSYLNSGYGAGGYGYSYPGYYYRPGSYTFFNN